MRLSFRQEKLQRQYSQSWTTEVYFVHSRRMRSGVPIYKISDWSNEILFGTFYTPELQKVDRPSKNTLYDIEKVLKERTVKDSSGRPLKQSLIRYSGYHSKFDEWVNTASLTKVKKR